MGIYFKPLRRKFGVATLGIVCSLMIVWIRSLSIQDSIQLPLGQASSVQAISAHHGLLFLLIRATEADSQLSCVHLFEDEIYEDDYFVHCGKIMYLAEITPFRRQTYGLGHGSQTYQIIDFQVPFWAMILPSIVLSVWLLLSKSGPLKKTQTVQSNTEQVM